MNLGLINVGDRYGGLADNDEASGGGDHAVFGAGTTTVTHTFQQISQREKFPAAIVEGKALHRYDRAETILKLQQARERDEYLAHFGPKLNLFEELEALFRTYGETGRGRIRKYLHSDEEAAAHNQPAGSLTPVEILGDSYGGD